ncbi:MAG: hypothetical protein L0Z50_00545, partial [Verrucomicrobiales bacterium]|nr:hypothetical protein [Verrucomicrobiales bacterium]
GRNRTGISVFGTLNQTDLQPCQTVSWSTYASNALIVVAFRASVKPFGNSFITLRLLSQYSANIALLAVLLALPICISIAICGVFVIVDAFGLTCD